jgi:hypothetical protein
MQYYIPKDTQVWLWKELDRSDMPEYFQTEIGVLYDEGDIHRRYSQDGSTPSISFHLPKNNKGIVLLEVDEEKIRQFR